MYTAHSQTLNGIAKQSLVLLCNHCVKNLRIWSFSGLYFSAFGLIMERISSYSVQMRENTDQENSGWGHF